MKKLRELLSDTLVYGISSVVARFLNYLLVPFYTDVFDPSAYGIIGLIYSAIAFLNVVFTFGMESAYLRYAADRDKSRDVFKTLQTTLLGATILLGVALWLVKPFVMPLVGLTSSHESIYLMMIGILWFDAMGIVPFAELRLVRKSWLFSGLKLFNVLLNLGLNFYLVLAMGWGIEAVFVSNLVASGLTTLTLWGLTVKQLKGKWHKAVSKRALRFGLPFVPTGVAYAVNEFIDRFFLNGMAQENITRLYGAGFSPEAITGVYNACYKLAVFMLLFIQMFRMAWQPFFMRHSDDPDAKKLYSSVFTYFNVTAGIIFLGISLFAEEIVQIKIPVLDAYLIGKEYWMGLHIVPILLAAYWFQGWYVNFTAGIFIKERTERLPQITLIGATVTIVANILLVPRIGMLGAAISTLGSYIVMALLIYYYSRKAYPVPYSIWRGAAMILLSVLVLFIPVYLDFGAVHQWISKAVALGIGVVLMLFIGFSGSQLLFKKYKV